MFLDHWTDAVGAGLEARSRFPHFLGVRYEAFLAEPRRSAAELFQFLGVDAGAAVVGGCVETASFKAMSGGRASGDEDQHSFFRKGVAGDRKEWFTREQRDKSAARAGDLMKLAGYSPSGGGGSYSNF